ncbi:hypothetical protein mflW37_3090 [Mesoplasma florum W37]|uniref:Uncharacterized protein n=1 Tax=Mesoplasma florum TaxID=2151 RepID=A0AAD2JDX5_MESFO|nr:hypothetical protein [Mesoplasma florum]AGY41376.1 hypothetical protein mflW37_3090 [Mesoplasma florum W37]AVN59599.1 hypothetical protein CG008_01615 [Mesoplasma florum]AVN65716.1 hypothetical protein MflW12_3110 [Mesoplasma florum]
MAKIKKLIINIKNIISFIFKWLAKELLKLFIIFIIISILILPSINLKFKEFIDLFSSNKWFPLILFLTVLIMAIICRILYYWFSKKWTWNTQINSLKRYVKELNQNKSYENNLYKILEIKYTNWKIEKLEIEKINEGPIFIMYMLVIVSVPTVFIYSILFSFIDQPNPFSFVKILLSSSLTTLFFNSIFYLYKMIKIKKEFENKESLYFSNKSADFIHIYSIDELSRVRNEINKLNLFKNQKITKFEKEQYLKQVKWLKYQIDLNSFFNYVWINENEKSVKTKKKLKKINKQNWIILHYKIEQNIFKSIYLNEKNS